MTALLFTVWRILIGLYIGKSGVASGFAAASRDCGKFCTAQVYAVRPGRHEHQVLVQEAFVRLLSRWTQHAGLHRPASRAATSHDGATVATIAGQRNNPARDPSLGSFGVRPMPLRSRWQARMRCALLTVLGQPHGPMGLAFSPPSKPTPTRARCL